MEVGPGLRNQGCGLGLEVSVWRQSRELTTSRLGLGLGLCHVVGRDVLCGVRAVWHSIVVVVPYRPICLSP